MSDNYAKAYYLGCKLAEQEFSGSKEESVSPIEDLTEALDSILDNNKITNKTEVLDSSERPGSATWGDKMELETAKNTGLNV